MPTPLAIKLSRLTNPVPVWTPQAGPQTLALSRYEEEILYGGARGGGKTDAGISWFTRWTHLPRLRGLVIRRNADDLNDWIDRARQRYSALGAESVGKPAEFRFPSGAIIRTGHLKDEDAYEKYQGHEYQKMLIEELTQIPSEEAYLKLLASNRSTVPGIRPQVFLTTNPGGEGHVWVRERWGLHGSPREMIMSVDAKTGHRLVFIPARISDNPALVSADPAYIRFLDGLPDMLKRAWRDGDWDVFAGQFFTLWSAEKHVKERFPIPETWVKIRAIDPSGRNGITCCLWGALDHDGSLWIYREYYGSGRDTDQHAKAIAELSLGEEYRYTVIDSSAFGKMGMPETQAEVFERLDVSGLIPSDKSRVRGWDAMNSYLRWEPGNPARLRVFDCCPNLIRTIPLMQHDKFNFEDLDSDGEDHACDAARYMIQTLRDQAVPTPESLAERELRRSQERGRMSDDDYSFHRN